MILLDQGGRGRPWSRLSGPPADLSPYVESLWRQALPPTEASKRWRIVPDASAHILVKRYVATGNSEARTVLSLVGPRPVYVDIDGTGRCFTVGARLRPGAVPALFGVSADEIRGRAIPLDEIDPADAREAARLRAATTASTACRALVRWCRVILGAAREIEPRAVVLGRLVAEESDRRVGDLARRVGLSARRLRAVARTEIGLAPKRLTRIARAYATLRRGAHADHEGLDWSSIAVRSGYCDQSHMIHDFRDLFGESPRRFLDRGRCGDDRFLQSPGAGRT